MLSDEKIIPRRCCTIQDGIIAVWMYRIKVDSWHKRWHLLARNTWEMQPDKAGIHYSTSKTGSCVYWMLLVCLHVFFPRAFDFVPWFFPFLFLFFDIRKWCTSLYSNYFTFLFMRLLIIQWIDNVMDGTWDNKSFKSIELTAHHLGVLEWLSIEI